MKLFKNISYAFMSFMVMGALLITSCEEDDGIPLQEPNGDPEIFYIRVTDPDASDSLLVSATLGSGIVIVGKNLGGTREIWFNDKQADLTPSWVTNSTILVSVPSVAPTTITNKLYLVDDKGDTLKHNFEVAIPEPELYSARNEWPQESENLVINGNYLFEPITVSFKGGVTGEVVSVTQNRLEVAIPEGAIEGPVTVSTNFGSTASTFHIWDSRNVILDFDNVRGNGWRIGLVESGDGGVDGDYNVFRAPLEPGRNEGPGAPAESGYLFEYWGGTAGRTTNFYPLYPDSYKDYVMKFEAKVNTWYGGYLNICLSSPTHDGNNQEIWSNNYNARAIWGPWEDEGESFTTGDQWITVVVPMTDFQYHYNGSEYTDGHTFIQENAGTLSMWLIGSAENDGSIVEFYIDNIRFVQP